LDFILSKSAHSKVAYVGHSMGTSVMYRSLAMNYEETSRKVSIFVALAPVTKITEATSPVLKLLGYQYGILSKATNILGINELMRPNWLFKHGFKVACGYVPIYCDVLLLLTAAKNTEYTDDDRSKVFMGHYPAGTSMQTAYHFLQVWHANNFQEYDWGEAENMSVYG